MPIKTFANDTTADVFYGRNTKSAIRIAEKIRKAAGRKMEVLNAAKDTRELSALPGTRFEDLKHTKPGYCSMRINDQYRLIFRFEKGDAYDVEITDDHTGRR